MSAPQRTWHTLDPNTSLHSIPRAQRWQCQYGLGPSRCRGLAAEVSQAEHIQVLIKTCVTILTRTRTHIVFHPRSPKLSMTQRILGAWTEIWSLPIQLVAAFTALFSQVASRPSGDRRHGRLTWKSENLMHGLSKNQRLPQTISVSYWKLMNIGLSIGVNLWMLGARLFWTPVLFNDSMKLRTWT